MDLEYEAGAPNVIPQNTVAQEVPKPKNLNFMFLLIGFLCFYNFLFSLNCNYRLREFLVVNSFVYLIYSVYIFRKNIDLCDFTSIYGITMIILFLLLAFLRYNYCPEPTCPTLVPTSKPTNST